MCSCRVVSVSICIPDFQQQEFFSLGGGIGVVRSGRGWNATGWEHLQGYYNISKVMIYLAKFY